MMIQNVKIILLCIAAAIAYGVGHDVDSIETKPTSDEKTDGLPVRNLPALERGGCKAL